MIMHQFSNHEMNIPMTLHEFTYMLDKVSEETLRKAITTTADHSKDFHRAQLKTMRHAETQSETVEEIFGKLTD